jgi:hypothetical protein
MHAFIAKENARRFHRQLRTIVANADCIQPAELEKLSGLMKRCRVSSVSERLGLRILLAWRVTLWKFLGIFSFDMRLLFYKATPLLKPHHSKSHLGQDVGPIQLEVRRRPAANALHSEH